MINLPVKLLPMKYVGKVVEMHGFPVSPPLITRGRKDNEAEDGESER